MQSHEKLYMLQLAKMIIQQKLSITDKFVYSLVYKSVSFFIQILQLKYTYKYNKQHGFTLDTSTIINLFVFVKYAFDTFIKIERVLCYLYRFYKDIRHCSYKKIM